MSGIIFTNTLNLKGSLAFPDDPDLSQMERTSALPFLLHRQEPWSHWFFRRRKFTRLPPRDAVASN